MIKGFLLNKNNIEKNSYVWNMTGSMLNAFQSVIMLVIMTRTIELSQSGVFTIAFANANLFLNLGNYGMRNYQVSDIKKKYSFKEYYYSRLISDAAMLLFAFIYIAFAAATQGYTSDKTWIMVWMVLLKVVDSIENVFHGQYQQNNRLDVAGRCMTIRMIMIIITFGAGLIVLKDLLIALIITTIVTTFVFLFFTKLTYQIALETPSELAIETKDPMSYSFSKLKSLMWHCFPLCAGAFLSFYIGNAPKYAIDAKLSSELQACYGFIAMPVFVVGLLNNFIFMPQMFTLSNLWDKRDMKKFMKRIVRQVLILCGITAVCILGAYLLGIPVLSFMYNTDLTDFKIPLLILLLGGGFLGFTGFMSALITIIRMQKYMMIGYVAVAAMALLLSNKVVELYGITGASVLYAALMAILSLFFMVIFFIGVKSRGKTSKEITA